MPCMGYWEKIHFLENKKERIVKYLIIKKLLQYDVDKEIQGLLSYSNRIEEKTSYVLTIF